MPIDVVLVIGGLTLAGIGMCLFLEGVERYRRDNPPYDPDDWPAHLGIPPNFKARERDIQPTKRKGRGKAA